VNRNRMQFIPAIDLLHGDVVRLRQGDFDDCKRYHINAARLAANYADAGAGWLHVVDLAASRDGSSAGPEALLALLEQVTQKVQTGGGVRAAADIDKRLKAGADRVVVGTVCVSQTSGFLRWLDEFGVDRIVSALDVTFDENGVPWPRIHGWTKGSERNLWDLLDELTAHGLRHLLCTDIGRDGVLSGPNLQLYCELTKRYPELEVQASGGVSGLSDLRQLKSTGAAAVITGKALLEGRFTVQEALGALA